MRGVAQVVQVWRRVRRGLATLDGSARLEKELGWVFDSGAPENNTKNGVANPFLLMQEFASWSCIRLDGLDDEPKLPVENEAQASLAQLAEHALRKRTVVGSIPTGGYASFALRATHAGCSYARDSARCSLRASSSTAFLAPPGGPAKK